MIMDELCDKEGGWINSEYGKIVAKKVKLSLYKRNKEDWKNYLTKDNKVESLLKIME